MRMTDIAIDRPVLTTMVTLGACVLGIMAVDRLGLDLFPDVSFPVVTIVTPYPGASPSEVEAEVTKPLEEALSSINGIDKVRSTSRDSASTVIIQFDLDVDVRRAVNDVRDRVAIVRGSMPIDVLDPVVTRVDPTAIPVMTYAVSSPRSSIETRRFVDKVIRPALEKLNDVARVTIKGGAEREIQVKLDRTKLERWGLTVAAVAQTLQAETIDISSGRLTLGRREEAVKASGRFQRVQDVKDMVLLAQPDGTRVRVSDVARVVDGEKERRTATRVNGVEAVTFDVQKQGGANSVAVVDRVKAALKKLSGSLPEDVTVTAVLDTSKYIRTNIENLWSHLLTGGAMAVLVIFVFMLDWRSTLISSLALPTSVIATFFVMWQLGFTLNIMSMLALTLAIGILIDDSVVVRENIFRHMEQGKDAMTAAREGTREIAAAVLATTLTIVAVFMPVAFTGGMIGSFFRQFGITVTVAVVISLIVSFTLDPMLSARMTRQIPTDYHERQRRHLLWGWLVRFYEWMDDAYRATLAFSLRHKFLVVLSAVGIFVGSLMLAPLLGQEFAGRGDRGEFTVVVDLPAGVSFDETDRLTAQVERIIRAVPEVVNVATVLGPNQVVNKANIRVAATPMDQRERSIGVIMEELRGQLASIPGLDFYIREAGIGESSLEQAPVTIFVRGPDYTKLSRYARDVLTLVKRTPGVRDASMDYRPGAREQLVYADRVKVSDQRISFAAVSTTMRTALNGATVSKLRDRGDDIDVRVMLADRDRADLSGLLELQVRSPTGLVRLEDVTSTASATTPSTIERLDRERQIAITANVYKRSLGEVIGDIGTRLKAVEAPAGCSVTFGGEAEQMQDTFANLGLALGLAVLFIYMVLASQFESFIHPLTIMVALPLAVVGALIALFLSAQAFGMAAFIGIILLMGLVTKNSILLVDCANELRKKGVATADALVEAGVTRLRPILMTSAAIVLGMLPAALSRGEGSEFQAPMSIAVIGGVITSTLLTLLIVPAVYLWMDKLTVAGWRERRAARALRRAKKREPAAEAQAS